MHKDIFFLRFSSPHPRCHKNEVSNKHDRNGMKSALNQDAKCWRFGASPGGSRGKPIMRVPSVGGAPHQQTNSSHRRTHNTFSQQNKEHFFWKMEGEDCFQFGSSLFKSPPLFNLVWRGGLQCSFGWPPWPRWSASERFGSAPQHDTFALKCWGHEWNFWVGYRVNNLTSFVHVSFVSLMLWHCGNLSDQKGWSDFWISGTLVFLPQAYKRSPATTKADIVQICNIRKPNAD